MATDGKDKQTVDTMKHAKAVKERMLSKNVRKLQHREASTPTVDSNTVIMIYVYMRKPSFHSHFLDIFEILKFTELYPSIYPLQ